MPAFRNLTNSIMTITDIDPHITIQPFATVFIKDVIAAASNQIDDLLSSGLIQVVPDAVSEGVDVITRQELDEALVVAQFNVKVGQIPIGNIDGTRTTFGIPNGDIVAGNTLSVFLNGLRYDDSEILLAPTRDSFTIIGVPIPQPGDTLRINYVAQ